MPNANLTALSFLEPELRQPKLIYIAGLEIFYLFAPVT